MAAINGTNESLFTGALGTEFFIHSLIFGILCGAALILNPLCIVLISCSSFLRASSPYQCVMAIAANGFLFAMSLLLTWLQGFDINFEVGPVACPLVMYLQSVTSLVPGYFIATLSIERLLAVCSPIMHRRSCSVVKTRIALLVITFLGFFLGSFYLGTIVFNGYECVVTKGAGTSIFYLRIGEIFVSFWIPCLIITISNVVTAAKTVRGSGQFAQFNLPTVRPRRHRRSTNSNFTRGTCTILAVSTLYIVLNLPHYAARTKSLLGKSIAAEPSLFEAVAHYLYYLECFVNVIVYGFFDRNFQKKVCVVCVPVHRPKASVVRQLVISFTANAVISTRPRIYSKTPS